MVFARQIGRVFAAAGLLATGLAFSGQAAADGSIKDSGAPAQTERGVWFSGYDVVTGARYAFDGIIVALNRDMSKDGWALRAYGSRVDFDQDPGDGRGWQGDVMLGYMFHRSAVEGGIYFGADYQNVKLRPDDPTSSVRGTDWGAKVAADLSTTDSQPVYFGLAGSYSTSFDSYWARARVGLNRNRYVIGAEAAAFGNEDFDATRLGAFLTFNVNLRPNMSPLEVTLAGGHQFVKDTVTAGTSTGGSDGTYGTITFSMSF